MYDTHARAASMSCAMRAYVRAPSYTLHVYTTTYDRALATNYNYMTKYYNVVTASRIVSHYCCYAWDDDALIEIEPTYVVVTFSAGGKIT